MERVITGNSAKLIDKYTIEQIGIPSMVLMERAALGVFDEIKNNYYNYLIVCGNGNNGADGIALSRMLFLNGENVTVLLVSKGSGSEEYNRQLDIASKIGVEIIDYANEENLDLEYLEEAFSSYDCIVDAIFGIGLNRDVSGSYYDIIEKINESDNDICSIDIASGICPDNGKVMGIAVKADITVTFGEYKIGHLAYPGREYAGELIKKDIGFVYGEDLNNQDEANDTNDCFMITKSDLVLIPKRIERSNKGSYGKLLVIAGSKDMSGAAYLCGMAAYRMGAGLVHIVTHNNNVGILKDKLPEAVFTGYDNLSDENGNINESEFDKLREVIQKYDNIVIGPGIGVNDVSNKLVEFVLESKKNTIIDADGINVISADKNLFNLLHDRCIITPHMGEMSRLTNKSIGEISENTFEICKQFAEKVSINLILKDANTIISLNDGSSFINTSGNEGMSTAGSGDVLSGVLGGLMCIGCKFDMIAPLGTFIHGLSGDFAKEKMGSASLMARDIVDGISDVMLLKENTY